MTETYRVNVGGLERRYPIVPLSDDTNGVYFFMPGDVELIEHVGRLISDQIGAACDYILVPEVGGVPLAHVTAQRLRTDYLVARKSVKPYMDAPIVEDVQSITTPGEQELVLDGRDIEKIRGKRVALIDDVVSTMGTMRGLFRLATRCSARVTYIATVFLEGETTDSLLEAEFGCPTISFDWLPLFPVHEE